MVSKIGITLALVAVLPFVYVLLFVIFLTTASVSMAEGLLNVWRKK